MPLTNSTLLPAHSELTVDLATKAFELVGANEFQVSTRLSIDDSDSIRNFGTLERILLMAYEQGYADAQKLSG